MKTEINRLEQLEGRKFDQVIVHVSPFQRTVSTCAEIAKEIGITQVKMDYAFVEFLKQELYPNGDPLPNLELRKLGIDAFNAKYGKDGSVTFIDDEAEYQRLCTGQYPETKPQKNERVKRNYLQQVALFKDS